MKMSKMSNNPRCKCCDEVMEELLTMRQSFEKMLHRLTKQVVDLRREVSEVLENNTNGTKGTNVSNGANSNKTINEDPFRRNSESEMEMPDIGFGNNSSDEELAKPLAKNKINTLSMAQQIKPETKQQTIQCEDTKTVPRVSQPAMKFFKTRGRVLPKKPFTEAQQFEDWNSILYNDEDQREQLRTELLKGDFDEPDKYIMHIWRMLLKNEAAQFFSYRGLGRCNKKSMKSYLFTDIFRECFLQRFHHMDATFFMERTMRFFSYAHGHKRKMDRERRKQSVFSSDMSMDEPTIDMI